MCVFYQLQLLPQIEISARRAAPFNRSTINETSFKEFPIFIFILRLLLPRVVYSHLSGTTLQSTGDTNKGLFMYLFINIIQVKKLQYINIDDSL